MDDCTFNVTREAVKQVKAALEKRDTPKAALRIGVRGGGCSGFMYHLEYCDNLPRETDNIFVFQNADDDCQVTIVIDHKSMVYLNGAELAWEQEMLRWGFRIHNPQVKSECGCKESFSVV